MEINQWRPDVPARMMRRVPLAVALALAVIVAGCAGAPGGETTATTDDGPTGTTVTTDDGPTETSAAITTTTAAPTTAGDDADATTTNTSVNVDADALATAGASSLATAEGVVVRGNLTRTLRTASGATTVETTFTERDDVTDRELAINQTVRANGQTVETATYLVNGTFYQRSPAYERQYGSAWVRAPGDGQWANASSTAVVKRLINASEASAVERTTVDGASAVVLALDVNRSELAAVSGFPVDEDLNALSGTVTVDADTGRVYASTVRINRTTTNSYGQEVTVVTAASREFETYGPVTIDLPSGADEATPINGTQP